MQTLAHEALPASATGRAATQQHSGRATTQAERADDPHPASTTHRPLPQQDRSDQISRTQSSTDNRRRRRGHGESAAAPPAESARVSLTPPPDCTSASCSLSVCQNIPGLDAPSWSRISGNDEQQEEEEERQAEQRWQQQQKAGVKAVTYTPAAAAASSSTPAAAPAAPLPCDLLVVACGMLSSAFLSTMIDGLDGAASPLQEIGRFTVAAEDTGAPAVASTKQSRAEAARPYALILASLPGASSSTIYAFNYLRATASQYFDLTAALFAHVQPKQIMVLDTLHHGAFISQERPTPSPPILRMLQTTTAGASAAPAAAASASASPSFPAVSALPPLEPPNLVSTFSASVLTHAEVSHLPARLYLSMESRHYVVETMQAFEAAWGPFLASLAPDAAVALRLIAKQFLGESEKRRIAGYKAATARVQKVYGYSAGQDASMRETAGQVQRDHQLEMFF